MPVKRFDSCKTNDCPMLQSFQSLNGQFAKKMIMATDKNQTLDCQNYKNIYKLQTFCHFFCYINTCYKKNTNYRLFVTISVTLMLAIKKCLKKRGNFMPIACTFV
jgi:hypothetical protein